MVEDRGRGPASRRDLVTVALVAALVGGGVGYGTSVLSRPGGHAPQDREFWVFTTVLPFDDGRPGFPPHDYFAPDRITVNRGDSVTIHFFNTETDPENHSFTMDAPYEMDQVLAYGHTTNFTFVASASGIFAYHCRFHQPSMTGYLTVLDE